MLLDLIRKNRSYRRFDNSHKLTRTCLEGLVEAARLSASAANLQVLRFFLACEEKDLQSVFPHLKWAGYMPEWDGPTPAEQPTGYIVILSPPGASKYQLLDTGIVSQSILLAATEQGLGGCMFASFQPEALHKALMLPPDYEIVLVIALGKPAETVQIDPVDASGNIKYHRDTNGIHHVPKRALKDILLN
ncbi:MAG: nitroreductase family protein [Candidatus Cloacimonadota bacterium]